MEVTLTRPVANISNDLFSRCSSLSPGSMPAFLSRSRKVAPGYWAGGGGNVMGPGSSRHGHMAAVSQEPCGPVKKRFGRRTESSLGAQGQMGNEARACFPRRLGLGVEPGQDATGQGDIDPLRPILQQGRIDIRQSP